MVALHSYLLLTILSLTMFVGASHIDDVNGELTNLKFDQVIFRLKKDCSLDRQPEVIIRFRLYIWNAYS